MSRAWAKRVKADTASAILAVLVIIDIVIILLEKIKLMQNEVDFEGWSRVLGHDNGGQNGVMGLLKRTSERGEKQVGESGRMQAHELSKMQKREARSGFARNQQQ